MRLTLLGVVAVLGFVSLLALLRGTRGTTLSQEM